MSGILVSLFEAVIDVGNRRRKASYITHFFQERLDRSERRNLIMILANFQKSLLRDNTKISATLQEGKVEEDEIPTRLQILFKKLGGLDK
jgi:hypothetical protein